MAHIVSGLISSRLFLYFSSFGVFTSLGCRFDPRSGSPFYSLLVLMTVLVQGVRLRSRLTNFFFGIDLFGNDTNECVSRFLLFTFSPL